LTQAMDVWRRIPYYRRFSSGVSFLTSKMAAILHPFARSDVV
jgi:hypothetical protein